MILDCQQSHFQYFCETVIWGYLAAFVEACNPGLVFTNGLRFSQVLGLNPVLKLRLLSQISVVLKPYSQKVT